MNIVEHFKSGNKTGYFLVKHPKLSTGNGSKPDSSSDGGADTSDGEITSFKFPVYNELTIEPEYDEDLARAFDYAVTNVHDILLTDIIVDGQRYTRFTYYLRHKTTWAGYDPAVRALFETRTDPNHASGLWHLPDNFSTGLYKKQALNWTDKVYLYKEGGTESPEAPYQMVLTGIDESVIEKIKSVDPDELRQGINGHPGNPHPEFERHDFTMTITKSLPESIGRVRSYFNDEINEKAFMHSRKILHLVDEVNNGNDIVIKSKYRISNLPRLSDDYLGL